LAGLGDWGARVLDAELAARAIDISETVVLDLGATAVAEVTFEPGQAVAVGVALRDGGDVASPVGAIAIASDGAVPVGEANPEIVSRTTICRRIAESIGRAVDVALAGYLDLATDGLRAVDGTASEDEEQGEEGSCA
jgi:hypothetical protein